MSDVQWGAAWTVMAGSFSSLLIHNNDARLVQGSGQVSPWLQWMQCEKGPLFIYFFLIGGAVGGFHSVFFFFFFHGEKKKPSRAFRRSTRTPLRCVAQSPSSRGSLCPLSCGWGPGRWLCCSGRIWSGRESLEETGRGWWRWCDEDRKMLELDSSARIYHVKFTPNEAVESKSRWCFCFLSQRAESSAGLPVTQRREKDNQRSTATERVRSGEEIEGQREGARRRYGEMEENAGGRRGNARWWDQGAAWVTAVRRGMDVREERK